jgi:hypothetical protein
MRDADLARLLNRTTKSVASRRLKRKVPPFTTQGTPWTQTEVDLLGKLTNQEIANRTGRRIAAVAQMRSRLGVPSCNVHRWKPEEDRLLGTASDKEIAMRLNCSETSVRCRRRLLRIRRCQPEKET